MGPLEIVEQVLRALNELAIPYMIVGSLSSNLYGEPRMTKDADFVIQLGNTPLSALMEKLGPEFRIDRQMGFETVTAASRYLIEHVEGEFAVELFELTADPFNQQRFARRRAVNFADVPAFVPTAEDVIIQKLRWYVRAKRVKDIEDVRSVMETQTGQLDLEYIRRWTEEHQTREMFEEMLGEAAG